METVWKPGPNLSLFQSNCKSTHVNHVGHPIDQSIGSRQRPTVQAKIIIEISQCFNLESEFKPKKKKNADSDARFLN